MKCQMNLIEICIIVAAISNIASSQIHDYLKNVKKESNGRVSSVDIRPTTQKFTDQVKKVPTHMQGFHSRVLERIRSMQNQKEEMLIRSPEYMLQLYQRKSPSENHKDLPAFNGKHNKALKRSDVVRSFNIIESYKESTKWVLAFDLSAILPHERIRMAEIELTVPRDYFDVTTIELWSQRMGQQTKIGSVAFNARRKPTSQKIIIDVTKVVRTWYKSDEENESEMSGIAGQQTRSKRAIISSTMLFVYSTNKQFDLMDVAAARYTRSRRSASSKSRSAHQRNRKNKRRRTSLKKKNKTAHRYTKTTLDKYSNNFELERNVQEAKLGFSNDFEFSDQFPEEKTKKAAKTSTEQDFWEQQKIDDVVVIKQKKTDKKLVTPAPLSPFGVSYPKHVAKEPTHCRVVDFEVDFEKIGWGSWIIYPKKYNAKRCAGECRLPITGGSRPTNHAYMQGLISVNRPELEVPQPCCVPTKLKPLSILYYEGDVVKQRDHEDMVVIECGCR